MAEHNFVDVTTQGSELLTFMLPQFRSGIVWLFPVSFIDWLTQHTWNAGKTLKGVADHDFNGVTAQGFGLSSDHL